MVLRTPPPPPRACRFAIATSHISNFAFGWRVESRAVGGRNDPLTFKVSKARLSLYLYAGKIGLWIKLCELLTSGVIIKGRPLNQSPTKTLSMLPDTIIRRKKIILAALIVVATVCVPQAYAATCGDGTIETPDEMCDDGNSLNADGCSDSCQIESGYQCVGEPSVCSIVPLVTAGMDSTALGAGISSAIGDFTDGFGPIIITIVGIVLAMFGLNYVYSRTKTDVVIMSANKALDENETIRVTNMSDEEFIEYVKKGGKKRRRKYSKALAQAEINVIEKQA